MTGNLYDEALALDARKVARVRLARQLDAYFEVTLAGRVSAQDVVNLTHQAMDAVESVIAGYPPLHGVLDGIETVDSRTLAVD
jgi:hypothetical protein